MNEVTIFFDYEVSKEPKILQNVPDHVIASWYEFNMVDFEEPIGEKNKKTIIPFHNIKKIIIIS